MSFAVSPAAILAQTGGKKKKKKNTPMAKGRPTLLPHLLALSRTNGKSRRWRDVHTGETISYNAGRARVASFSASHRTKTARFERA